MEKDKARTGSLEVLFSVAPEMAQPWAYTWSFRQAEVSVILLLSLAFYYYGYK